MSVGENASDEQDSLRPGDFVVPTGCFLDVLNMQLVDVAPGRAMALMTIGPQHLNQAGVAQAGSIMSFADATAGWATKASVMAAGSSFTTLELNANILRAANEGAQLEAVATTEHQGRTTAVVKVDVRTSGVPEGDRRLLATFRCTQLIITPKAGAGEPSR